MCPLPHSGRESACRCPQAVTSIQKRENEANKGENQQVSAGFSSLVERFVCTSSAVTVALADNFSFSFDFNLNLCTLRN